MATKQCPQCGTQFEGRANKLYCSLNCKMTAFYAANGKKSLTVNGLTDESSKELLTVEPSEQPLSVKQNETGMATIPVPFSVAEKELLEKQASECETVLPNLIRIRCLMDETDIRIMRRTIKEQKRQIEELRVKLSFYQEQENHPESVKQLTDKPVNGLLIRMSERQLQFLMEKYLESFDYDDPDTKTRLPDGSYTGNEREVLELDEQERPGHICYSMGTAMVYNLLDQIEERLVEHCGYHKKEDFEENPLIEAFDNFE